MTRRGWALFAVMGVVWGIPYLLIKVAVADVSPPTLVFVRTLVGAAILVPIAGWRGDLAPLRQHWRWLLAYTVIEVAIPWLMLSEAETKLSSSLTGLMAAVPLIGAVIAWRLGSRDRLDARATVGLLIGFVGVGALVGLDVSFRDISAVGEMAVVAVCYAVGPVIVARRLANAPAIGVVAASLGLTALVYGPVGVILAPHTMPSMQVIGAIVGLGVICTAVAFIAFFALIAEVGPVRATVITYINPAVALLLGVLLLHEPLGVGAAVGFLLIIGGSILTNRRRRESRAGKAAEPLAEAVGGG